MAWFRLVVGHADVANQDGQVNVRDIDPGEAATMVLDAVKRVTSTS